MFCTDVETVTAKKKHACTWCAQEISAGEKYLKWKSFEDSWFTNKMHHECKAALQEEISRYGDREYYPYENERPALGEGGAR